MTSAPAKTHGEAPRGGKRHGTATAEAWSNLAAAVAGTLAALVDEQCLVLSGKRRSCFVQFLSLGDRGIHVEAASNEWLRRKEALDRAAMARMRALGWIAPTLTRRQVEALEEDDETPAGCSNFSRDWAAPTPFAEIAASAITALREVYGLRRPGQLEYVAFAPGPREILLPTLGLDNLPLFDAEEDEDAHEPEVVTPESPAELQRAVVEALRSFTDLDEVEIDEDGDIPLRYGSALISLKVPDDAPFVELLAPVLLGVEPSPELYATLGELSRTHRQVKFYLFKSTVTATLELVADPFVPAHLAAALAVMGRVCDETGRDLQQRFGGRTAFETEPATRTRRRRIRYN